MLDLNDQGKSDVEIECHMCSDDSETGKAIENLRRSFVRHDWKDRKNKYNFAGACEQHEKDC